MVGVYQKDLFRKLFQTMALGFVNGVNVLRPGAPLAMHSAKSTSFVGRNVSARTSTRVSVPTVTMTATAAKVTAGWISFLEGGGRKRNKRRIEGSKL